MPLERAVHVSSAPWIAPAREADPRRACENCVVAYARCIRAKGLDVTCWEAYRACVADCKPDRRPFPVVAP